MIAEAQLKDEVRKIISNIIELDPGKIDIDAKFVEDLGMDSMMALEILAALEKRYRINIPEEELPKIKTLRDTIEVVKHYVK